jgi:uncharacterized protein
VTEAWTLAWRKWDGAPHGQHELERLGEDDTGTWFGQREGSTSMRPGMSELVRGDNVWNVVAGRGWTVRFFRAVEGGGWNVPRSVVGTLGLYSDIGTAIEVDDAARRITGIDLDLDVIRIGDRLVLDDEDEFADHRVAMMYPDEVAERAERDAAEVLDAVRVGTAPFDGRAVQWLDEFAASRGL